MFCKFNTMFWPNNINSFGIKFSANSLFKIQDVIMCELLVTFNFYNENGGLVFIVGKNKNSTNFIIKHYFKLKAYLYDEFIKESIKITAYNYSKIFGNFLAKSNSKFFIFINNSHIFAIFYSSMHKGFSSYVMFATPVW